MPLISRDKKFIFIQVPKTAGTSINEVLKKFSTPEDLSRWVNYEDNHSTLELVLGENHEVNQYFKFAVVRNPFDWLVSYYEYKRTEVIGDLYPHICNMPFNKFVPFLVEIKSGEIVGFNQSVMNVVNGQNSWTHCQGIPVLNKIIFYEQLEESFSLLSKELNLGKLVLPKLNISQRKPTFEYYDQATKDLVVEMFQQDFELFGYQKE